MYDRELFIEAARRIPDRPKEIQKYMTPQPDVTPNPNEEAHRGLKKAVRLIDRSRERTHEMIGEKSLMASDPRVAMVVDLAQAQGLIEGYMLGEEWKEKYYGKDE
ncbi:MAG: hypothetical protein V3S69_02325 [Dehalococcoidales bacterium]